MLTWNQEWYSWVTWLLCIKISIFIQIFKKGILYNQSNYMIVLCEQTNTQIGKTEISEVDF